MKNDIQFLQLSESNIPAIFAIECEQDFPWTEQLLHECFRANYRCYGILKQNELIGFAIIMLISDQAELLNIAINKKNQRKGYGKQLLRYTLIQALAENAKKVYLEVRISNLPARKLYQQFGFEKIGLRENYYPAHDGREDGEVYCLNIAIV